MLLNILVLKTNMTTTQTIYSIHTTDNPSIHPCLFAENRCKM